MADPQAVATAAILVSNTGDVFGGADLTFEAVTAIESTLGEEVEVIPVKEDLLADAASEGAEMQELFGTVGGFSVAAGILLVVNLFVMLAGERKSEMGTLRATGLRRGHLVRALSMEGAVYGILAAVSGVVVGIGVAAVVMTMAASLLNDGTFTVRLDVVPTSLVSGAVIGLMVSQLTVLATAWRSTRLNIVRAIRDLPEPPSIRGTRRQTVLGVIGFVGGAAAFALADGRPRWRNERVHPIRRVEEKGQSHQTRAEFKPMSVADGLVLLHVSSYQFRGGGSVAVLDAADGRELWRREFQPKQLYTQGSQRAVLRGGEVVILEKQRGRPG